MEKSYPIELWVVKFECFGHAFDREAETVDLRKCSSRGVLCRKLREIRELSSNHFCDGVVIFACHCFPFGLWLMVKPYTTASGHVKSGHVFQLDAKVCDKRLGLHGALFPVEPQRKCAGALSEALRASQGASAVQFSHDASMPSTIGHPHSLHPMTVHVVLQPEQVASSGSTVMLAPWLS